MGESGLTKFCTLPFVQVRMTGTGRLSPCCMIRDSDPLPKITSFDIEKNFNHPFLKELRRTYLANKVPDVCTNCMRNQQGYINYFNGKYKVDLREVVKGKSPLSHIKSLDITPTNECNLDCIMCGYGLVKKSEGKFLESLMDYKFKKQVWGPNEIDEFINSVKKISNLDTIILAGGETFVYQSSLAVLNRVKEVKIKNLQLITNGTIVNQALINTIKSLAEQGVEIVLAFSIDGLYKQYEFIRKGAKFEKVIKNIDVFVEALKDCVKIDFYTAIGIYNAFEAPELHEYLINRYHNIYHTVHFLRVSDPPVFNMINFPVHIKSELIKLYEEAKRNFPPYLEMGYNEAIKILNQEGSTEDFESFIEVVEKFGRDEFIATFPLGQTYFYPK